MPGMPRNHETTPFQAFFALFAALLKAPPMELPRPLNHPRMPETHPAMKLVKLDQMARPVLVQAKK